VDAWGESGASFLKIEVSGEAVERVMAAWYRLLGAGWPSRLSFV
jgi:hypothetical protein